MNKYDINQLKENEIDEKDYKELFLSEELRIKMENVFESQSLTTQRHLKKVIVDAIREEVNPDITFMELKKATGIDFVCNAVNVDTKQHVYFNPKDTPDVKVIDAVMASSCLPFMFQPVVINGERYYDGGICNACPVEYVSETSTIAFSIYVKGTDGGSRHPLNALLKTGYMPRLAQSSEFDKKSSHEFLFEQKCKSTRKSDWGEKRAKILDHFFEKLRAKFSV